MKTPILESERIVLRPLSLNDAEQIFKSWTSDPEVAKFMIWDQHQSIGDTMEWLKLEEDNIDSEHHYTWGFVLKETGELFGSGGIGFNKEHDCYELGYNIMKKYWGQGLTTEAGRAILDFASHTLGVKKFLCRHAVDNIGSKKVMIKLGFEYVSDSSYTSFSGQKHFLSKDYYLSLGADEERMFLNMKDIARKQLAIDMNCSEEDFMNDGLVFRKTKINSGCRNMKRQEPYLEIASMGKGIVVSGEEEILNRIKPLLIGKSREEIFEAPFLYGLSIYYLPDKNISRIERTFDGLEFVVKEQEAIADLNGIQGFDNAIGFAEDGSYTTGIVMFAKKGEQIVALAGASIDCDTMWQIGIDVLPEFRNQGLATYLVNRITFLIMEKGIVPYYCAASTNLSSQATAHRSGYVATWMSTYHNAFDGSSSFDEYLDIKKIL